MEVERVGFLNGGKGLCRSDSKQDEDGATTEKRGRVCSASYFW